MRINFGVLILFFAHFLIAQSYNSVDRIIDQRYKTVQLYRGEDKISYPVLNLNNNAVLRLEFDKLGTEYTELYTKIVACNADWSISPISALDYLDEYNEFRFSDIDYSFNAKVEYTHYYTQLPNIKLSGNYIVVVYPENEPDRPVIIKRFMVFDNRVRVERNNTFTSGANFGRQQLINFDIDYTGFPIDNPLQEVEVVIKQNGRWDNYMASLQPTFIRPQQYKLEYNFINSDKIFDGGMEFRMFDLRSIQFNGQYVNNVNRSLDTVHAFIDLDQPKNRYSYIFSNDINGKFLIDHYEDGHGEINCDYVKCTFTLKREECENDIYLLGAMNNWQLTEEFKMKYYPEIQAYRATPLLKQGYYNYKYVEFSQLDGVIDSAIEGSHSQSENDYEVLVYIKKPGQLQEQLVGYKLFTINGGN